MLQFIRRKKNRTPEPAKQEQPPFDPEKSKEPVSVDTPPADQPETGETAVDTPEASADAAKGTGGDEIEGGQSAGFFGRLASKIARTSSNLGDGIGQILLGKKEIDDELLEDIEMQLLTADVGVDSTRRIVDGLTAAIERDALTDPKALYKQLKLELNQSLQNQQDLVEVVVG